MIGWGMRGLQLFDASGKTDAESSGHDALDGNAVPLTEAYATVDGREMTQTRVFKAPQELVYRLWTDPEHLQHWLGPQGCTITHLETDTRPGGVWKLKIQGHDDRGRFRITVTLEEDGNNAGFTMCSVFHTLEDIWGND